MTASFRFGLPQTVRQVALLGLGVMLLGSCNQNTADNSLAASEGNGSVVAQVQKEAEPAIIQPEIAESSASEVAIEASDASPSSPSQPSEQTTISSPDLEIGLAYGEARARLIQQGWEPVVAAEPGPYGVERQLYDQGITEVSACSGNAVGACRFEFTHPERAQLGESSELSVITYGGSKVEVADWQLSAVAPMSEQPSDSLSEMPLEFQGLWDVNLYGLSFLKPLIGIRSACSRL